MLERTFCHIPGIGGCTERSLWQQGCLSWGDYLASPNDFQIGGVKRDYFDRYVQKSADLLERGDHKFFAQALGGKQAWRAWPQFRNRCVYLDIETDGGQRGESITMVGLYDGADFTCLVKGEDLDHFPDVIAKYSMIVTFFGAGFDIPMLKKAFPTVPFSQIHLDLCFSLKKVGYRGGLKKIEKQLGIARSDETDGLTGFDAIRLWAEYQGGSEASLKTLVEYNREDVVNLERLAEVAFEKLQHATLDEAGLAELAGKP
ncbi:MAG: ribonuclease H-like domain-containing protein [Armatimonadetes bacterium]|nr:ribonuclease H-like domain-containing protein [Armatimonadota bacterium]